MRLAMMLLLTAAAWADGPRMGPDYGGALVVLVAVAVLCLGAGSGARSGYRAALGRGDAPAFPAAAGAFQRVFALCVACAVVVAAGLWMLTEGEGSSGGMLRMIGIGAAMGTVAAGGLLGGIAALGAGVGARFSEALAGLLAWVPLCLLLSPAVFKALAG